MKSTYKFVYDTVLGIDDFNLENKVIDESGYREVADIELIRVKGDSDTVINAAAGMHADAVCGYITIDADGFKKLSNCKVVAAPAIGFDCFDLKAATENGICVCNCPSYCIEEVATHTVALALDALREIAKLDRNTRVGWWTWENRGIMRRLAGKTYGFISFGRIPQRMVEMLKGFEVTFLAWDPYLPDEVFKKLGVTRAATIEEVFSKSLIASVHTPAFPGTYHMIGDKQFNAIPDSMILIVTSRGGIVDEDALLRALKSGKISHAGLDVIEDETTFKTALQGVPNVTMTPHTAFYSEESTDQLREENMMQMLDAVVGKKEPQYVVNKDVKEIARFKKQ